MAKWYGIVGIADNILLCIFLCLSKLILFTASDSFNWIPSNGFVDLFDVVLIFVMFVVVVGLICKCL